MDGCLRKEYGVGMEMEQLTASSSRPPRAPTQPTTIPCLVSLSFPSPSRHQVSRPRRHVYVYNAWALLITLNNAPAKSAQPMHMNHHHQIHSLSSPCASSPARTHQTHASCAKIPARAAQSRRMQRGRAHCACPCTSRSANSPSGAIPNSHRPMH
jgi:hypothetical protein